MNQNLLKQRLLKDRLANPRWWMRFLLLCFVLWLLVLAGLASAIISRGDETTVMDADVIVVLGAGVRRDGSANSALYRRARHAAELYTAGYAPELLCTGGQAPSRPNSEAYACRTVLINAGVPSSAITLEEASRSTEENASFTALIAEEKSWDELLIVSDSFHILRAEYLFSQAGLNAVGSPVSRGYLRSSYFASQVIREVVAFHWQFFKDALGLPFTYVP